MTLVSILFVNEFFVEEWTIEKITDSFPITAASCRKLLRSKWAPKNLEELAKHDAKVIENWKILSEGRDQRGAKTI